MGTELAVVKTTPEGQVTVWKGLPKSLKRDRGLENMDQDDIAIPRLVLAQSGTPAVKKSSEKYIEGLSEGDFFNSISKRIYGPSVRIIPVAFTKNRVFYQDNQIDCRSENGVDGGNHAEKCSKCEYSAWGTGKDGKGTACTLFKNYVCYIPEDRKYALFSFKRGSLEMAKQFNATITDQTRVYEDENGTKIPFELDIFGCEYMLTATPKSQGEYSWFALGYKYVRDVADEALLDELKKQQDFFMVNRQIGSED